MRNLLLLAILILAAGCNMGPYSTTVASGGAARIACFEGDQPVLSTYASSWSVQEQRASDLTTDMARTLTAYEMNKNRSVTIRHGSCQVLRVTGTSVQADTLMRLDFTVGVYPEGAEAYLARPGSKPLAHR